jgi:hypothetical protein
LTLCVVVGTLALLIDVVAGRVADARDTRRVLLGLHNERRYRVANPIYHHDLRPGVSMDSAFWGAAFYPIRTNSLAFKDAAARDVPLVGSAPRVLFLGDSFTEGLGVPYDSTFVGRIAQRANGARAEVQNGAVASYSPLIYLRKTVDLIARRGVAVGEVIVFLDISDIQDEASYYVDSTGRIGSTMAVGFIGPVPSADELAGLTPHSTLAARARVFLRRNTFLTYRAVSWVSHWLRPPATQGPSCDAPLTMDSWSCRPGWTSSPAIMDRYGRTGLLRASAHMSELAHFLRERGIALTVVVYPWPQQLQWNDRHSRQVSFWRDWTAREHVRFVELFSDLFAEVDSGGLDRTIGRYFISGDVHFNAEGHAFVARQFLAHYCEAPAPDSTARAPLDAALCRRQSDTSRASAALLRPRPSE